MPTIKKEPSQFFFSKKTKKNAKKDFLLYDSSYKKYRVLIKDCIKNDPPILDKPNSHIKENNEYNYIQGVMLSPQKEKKNNVNTTEITNVTTNNTTITNTITRRITRPQNPLLRINRPQQTTTTWYSRLMNVLDTVTGDTIFTQLNQQGASLNSGNYYDIPLSALPASFLEPVQIQRNISISNTNTINDVTEESENKKETERTCIICMTDEPIYVCVPCGHMILCESCVKAGSHNQLQGKCPTCRSDIQTLTKVFI